MDEEKTEPVIKRPRLSAQVRAKIRAMWESGEYTASDIARVVKVDMAVVRRFIANHGIQKGASAQMLHQEVAEQVKKKAEEDAALFAERIRETKEEHYRMAVGIAKLTWQELSQCRSNEQQFSTINPNLKALESAMKVLSMSRMERYAVLGLDKEDKSEDAMPELVLTELTADQIERLRNFQADDKITIDDDEINQQFADGEIDVIEEGDDEIVEEGEDG
jgi:hypothetical protein